MEGAFFACRAFGTRVNVRLCVRFGSGIRPSVAHCRFAIRHSTACCGSRPCSHVCFYLLTARVRRVTGTKGRRRTLHLSRRRCVLFVLSGSRSCFSSAVRLPVFQWSSFVGALTTSGTRPAAYPTPGASKGRRRLHRGHPGPGGGPSPAGVCAPRFARTISHLAADVEALRPGGRLSGLTQRQKLSRRDSAAL